jgi:BASS family bile acid:Na+ symporter
VKPQQIATIVMLVSLMLSAGLEINRDHLLAVLKNYALLGRALLANFIIVPVFAALISRLLHLDGYVAIGFLLMGIAPGVPFLVRAAGRKPGGSLGFAATLAFLMPALSIVTIPLTSMLIFPPDIAEHVPFGKLIITLGVFQLIPLLIGLLIADRAPTVAARLQRPLLLLFFLAILVLLVLLGPTLIRDVLAVYGSHGIWAMLILVLLSVIIGWLLGGPEIEYRRTLSIATALRNIGTCAVISTASFPDTLVAPTVLTYFLVQFVVTVIFRVYFHRTATAAAS